MLRDRLGVSERWACRVVGQQRSTQRYQPASASADEALRGRLREISAERPRWGYRRAHALLREDGWAVNRKRVERLWREEGLRVPRRGGQRQRLRGGPGPGGGGGAPGAGAGGGGGVFCWLGLQRPARSPPEH